MKFTGQQKLEILVESIRSGRFRETCRKFRVSPQNLQNWRHRLYASADLIFFPGDIAARVERLEKLVADLRIENANLKDLNDESWSVNDT
jgi:transposase-like protein